MTFVDPQKGKILRLTGTAGDLLQVMMQNWSPSMKVQHVSDFNATKI